MVTGAWLDLRGSVSPTRMSRLNPNPSTAKKCTRNLLSLGMTLTLFCFFRVDSGFTKNTRQTRPKKWCSISTSHLMMVSRAAMWSCFKYAGRLSEPRPGSPITQKRSCPNLRARRYEGSIFRGDRVNSNTGPGDWSRTLNLPATETPSNDSPALFHAARLDLSGRAGPFELATVELRHDHS